MATDIYLYAPRLLNPADVILNDPTVANSTHVNTNVTLASNYLLTKINRVSQTGQVNVLLYSGEATPKDVKLRYIGLT